MALTVEATKLILADIITATEKSIERLGNYEKELANDHATLTFISESETNGDALPTNSPYGSYTEWKEKIQEQIQSSENSIARIGREKAELVAFKYFVDNAADE